MKPQKNPRKGDVFIPILRKSTLSKTFITGKERAGRRVLDRDGNAFVCDSVDSSGFHVTDRTPKTGDFRDGWDWRWSDGVRVDRIGGGLVCNSFYDAPFKRIFQRGVWDFMIIK